MEALSTWGYDGNGYTNQDGQKFMWVGFTDAAGTTYMFEAVEAHGYFVAGVHNGAGKITTSELSAARNGHTYKEQITAEHDAYCIGAALKSALENNVDRANYSVTLEEALEEAYGYLAEGLSNCRCMFAGLKGEAKIDYLLQFSESSWESMTQGGYYNDSTGELMQITWEEFLTAHAARTEREAHSEAEYLANEVAGDPNSYAAVVAADTVVTPSYSLLVNGVKSAHGTWVNKWGIAYAVARELTQAGMDADANVGTIGAVLELLEDPSTVILGDLEFSTVVESN